MAFNGMVTMMMMMMMVGFANPFIPGAESAPCPSTTVAMNVTSTSDVQNFTDMIACTGEGSFDIIWYPSVTITRTIELSNKKNVTVTGAGYPPNIRGSLVDDNGSHAGNGSGIFSVSNESTLRLSNLVLVGGNAERGGAVDLRLSSSLFISGCNFAYNNASNGGETAGFAVQAENVLTVQQEPDRIIRLRLTFPDEPPASWAMAEIF